MSHKSLQTIFLKTVEDLDLRFPVAEISEKTGIGQPTVSVYLSGKREVSPKFFKTFCEAFGLNYESIRKGTSHEEKNEPSTKEILKVMAEAFKAQTEIIRSIESKMAQESTQAMIRDQTTQMQFSLQDVQGKVTTLWERQHMAIEEIREHFAKLGVQKIPASEGAHKNGIIMVEIVEKFTSRLTGEAWA